MDNDYATYSYETITTTTDDGYYLPLIHIWNSKARSNSLGPILFQHGEGMDGADWIVNWKSPAPAIAMADAGHDVYLSSWRGTEYAKGH